MNTIVISINDGNTGIMSGSHTPPKKGGFIETLAGSNAVSGDTNFVSEHTNDGVLTKPYICYIDPSLQLGDCFTGILNTIESETNATLQAASPSSISGKAYDIVYDRPSKAIIKLSEGATAEVFNPMDGTSVTVFAETTYLNPVPCLVTAVSGSVNIVLEY